jgi:hypothetical protein
MLCCGAVILQLRNVNYAKENSSVDLTGVGWQSARPRTVGLQGLVKYLTPLESFLPVFHLIDWAAD